MRAGMVMAVAAVMMVAGCATVRESRVNPLNWFGSPEAAPVAAAPVAGPVGRTDGRVLVPQVTALHIERTTGGAIVRATGVAATQGWYQAALVPAADSTEEALVYEFVVQAPADVTRAGAPQSREIPVATFLRGVQLERLSTITVRGATNGMSTRR